MWTAKVVRGSQWAVEIPFLHANEADELTKQRIFPEFHCPEEVNANDSDPMTEIADESYKAVADENEEATNYDDSGLILEASQWLAERIC